MYYLKNWKVLISSVIALGAMAISIAVACYISGKNHEINPKNFEVLRIGVIDSMRLKAEAKCFRAHDEIAKRILELLIKIRKISTQMQDKTDRIKQDKKLKQKQKQSQLMQIEKKWKIRSTEYGKAMRKERNIDKKLTDYIQSNVLQMVNNIAKRFKIDIVINKGSQNMIHIFYNKENIDITDIVIDELNKTIPTIDLKEFE